MSKIEKEINKAIKVQEKKYDNDNDYKEMKIFWHNVIQSGLVKKTEYTLPPLDTIGKSVFELLSAKK